MYGKQVVGFSSHLELPFGRDSRELGEINHAIRSVLERHIDIKSNFVTGFNPMNNESHLQHLLGLLNMKYDVVFSPAIININYYDVSVYHNLGVNPCYPGNGWVYGDITEPDWAYNATGATEFAAVGRAMFSAFFQHSVPDLLRVGVR